MRNTRYAKRAMIIGAVMAMSAAMMACGQDDSAEAATTSGWETIEGSTEADNVEAESALSQEASTEEMPEAPAEGEAPADEDGDGVLDDAPTPPEGEAPSGEAPDGNPPSGEAPSGEAPAAPADGETPPEKPADAAE